MAIDSTLEVRRAGLIRLKAAAALTALVPAANIFPQVAPGRPWPFIAWGTPSIVPRQAACLDGSSVTVSVHGFALPREAGGQAVETAEDRAAKIGAQIARALDRYRADIAGGTATFAWTGGRLLIDAGEASAFHTVQDFRVRCATA